MGTKKIFLRILYVLACLVYLLVMAFHIIMLYFGETSIITTLLFYLNLGLILALISKLLSSLAWITKAKKQNLLLAVWITVSCLFGSELILKYGVKQHLSYGEQNGHFYRKSNHLIYRRYNQFKKKRIKPENFQLHIEEPGIRRVRSTPEYTHEFNYNKEGLRGIDWPIQKDTNEIRILGIGDSFTEGEAAPVDSTWLKSMEFYIQKANPNIQVSTINGGKSGSDIVYQLLLLKKKLLKYSPDLIILSLNTTDIADIIFRGCESRFQPDNTLKFNDPPWWEPLYGMSFIFRHILHDFFNLNHMLKFPAELKQEKEKAVSCIENTLAEFIAICKEQEIELILMTHPMEYGLFKEFEEYEMIKTIFQSAEVEYYIDMKTHFLKDGTISPENSNTYFWPLDRHHTSKGYWLWGKLIADYMIESAILDNSIKLINPEKLGLDTKKGF